MALLLQLAYYRRTACAIVYNQRRKRGHGIRNGCAPSTGGFHTCNRIRVVSTNADTGSEGLSGTDVVFPRASIDQGQVGHAGRCGSEAKDLHSGCAHDLGRLRVLHVCGLHQTERRRIAGYRPTVSGRGLLLSFTTSVSPVERSTSLPSFWSLIVTDAAEALGAFPAAVCAIAALVQANKQSRTRLLTMARRSIG